MIIWFQAFLADLSDTPLLIPHLPQANLLNNLQEWVRKRVKGAIDPGLHSAYIKMLQKNFGTVTFKLLR